MINIYIAKVPCLIDTYLYNEFLLQISTLKRKKIKKYTQTEDKYRTLMADLLVRYIIQTKLKIDNRNIAFNYNSYGKPYLYNHNGFFFNVSHSGNWVVCITHTNEVGVDIEKVQPIDIDIYEPIFKKEEFKDIIANNNKLYRFYELWTKKESVVKFMGKGLSIPFKTFSVMENTIQNIKELDINYKIHFKQYRIGSEYIISGCATDECFPEKIEIVSFAELSNSLLNKKLERNRI